MACSDQISSTDLENAKIDATTLAEIATSRDGGISGGALIDEATTRFSDTISTVRGQLAKLGYEVPIAYTTGISFTIDDGAKTVEESGIVYAPLIGSLPFTTSGTFIGDDDARFRVVSQDNIKPLVDQNTEDIATNTEDIATNTEDILALSPTDPVTGSATFTNSTNNIALTGIGAIDGLEIGDVIQITGTASNNTEFTVEVITDNDNVIVNQGHAGRTTTKALTNETASCTATLIAKWYEVGIGVGQGWVPATRSGGVTYTNSTGRSITVNIIVSTSSSVSRSVILNVDGIEVASSGEGTALSDRSRFVTAIIPNGSTYDIVLSSATIRFWRELR